MQRCGFQAHIGLYAVWLFTSDIMSSLCQSVDCCVVWSWSDYQEIESEHESDADAKLKDVMVAVGE